MAAGSITFRVRPPKLSPGQLALSAPKPDQWTPYEKPIAAAFVAAVEAHQSHIRADLLTAAVANNDADAIIHALGFPDLDARLKIQMTPPMLRVYEAGGEAGRAKVKVRVAKAQLLAGFGVTNPAATSFAQEQVGKLITRISSEQLRQVRDIIGVKGFGAGVPPAALGRMIAGSVGLNGPQANALDKFMRSQYNDLATKGTPATQRQTDIVQHRVDAYEARLLRQRGEMIARTEVISSGTQGQLDIWRAGQDSGYISPDAQKVWVVTSDDVTCEECQGMEGEQVPIEDEFSSGDDGPPLHPNCRCDVALASPEQAAAGGGGGAGGGGDQGMTDEERAQMEEDAQAAADAEVGGPIDINNLTDANQALLDYINSLPAEGRVGVGDVIKNTDAKYDSVVRGSLRRLADAGLISRIAPEQGMPERFFKNPPTPAEIETKRLADENKALLDRLTAEREAARLKAIQDQMDKLTTSQKLRYDAVKDAPQSAYQIAKTTGSYYGPTRTILRALADKGLIIREVDAAGKETFKSLSGATVAPPETVDVAALHVLANGESPVDSPEQTLARFDAAQKLADGSTFKETANSTSTQREYTVIRADGVEVGTIYRAGDARGATWTRSGGGVSPWTTRVEAARDLYIKTAPPETVAPEIIALPGLTAMLDQMQAEIDRAKPETPAQAEENSLIDTLMAAPSDWYRPYREGDPLPTRPNGEVMYHSIAEIPAWKRIKMDASEVYADHIEAYKALKGSGMTDKEIVQRLSDRALQLPTFNVMERPINAQNRIRDLQQAIGTPMKDTVSFTISPEEMNKMTQAYRMQAMHDEINPTHLLGDQPAFVANEIADLQRIITRDGGFLPRTGEAADVARWADVNGGITALAKEHLDAVIAVGKAVDIEAQKGFVLQESRLQAAAKEVDRLRAISYPLSREWQSAYHHGTPEEQRVTKAAMDKANKVTQDAQTKYDKLRAVKGQPYYDALAKIRPMGSDLTIKGEGPQNSKAKKAIVERQVKEAGATSYPKTWVDRSNERSGSGVEAIPTKPNQSGYNSGREIHSPAQENSVRAKSTALHELGHYMENYAGVNIRNAEWAFFTYRNFGERLQLLSDMMPYQGYDKKTYRTGKGYSDQWAHKYMGRDYGGHNYELLTMAEESLRYSSTPMDKEMRHWILGLLAAL